jgi:ASPIC and UnbV/FG-GAP-like repeat
MRTCGRRSSRMAWLLALAAAGTAATTIQSVVAEAPPPPKAPGFEDVAVAAGVAQRHSTRRFRNPYAEVMAGYTALGAAVAVADFDGDGLLDLFVTDSAEGGKNHLYRNDGDFTFTDVAGGAGVADGNDADDATADALFFDFNNDGRPDLFVVRFGRSQLFENLGGGRFRDVTRGSGLDGRRNAITAIAFDADRDGRLDLLVGSYFRPVDVFHPDTPRFFPDSMETADNGGGLTLFHNQGRGADGRTTFRDVTAAAGLSIDGWVLDVGHGDADGDGDDDLYVACDFGSDHFFVNDGDGTFTDRTREAIGIDTKKGMNAEWGDYDGDGRLDVFVTNITDDYMREGNFLWHNDGPDAAGEVSFTDVARETGSADSGWGWGGKFLDYDDDGWLDLFVVDGWVSAGPESYVPDIFAMITRPDVDLADVRNWPPMRDKSLSGYQRDRLFHNEGGRFFRDEAPRQGVDSLRDGRGVAVADFDGDGRLDLFVANAGDLPHLFRNRFPAGAHWLELELVGTRSNRDGVGAQARLTVGGRTLLRFVDGGNGFAAQSAKRLHFGLGTAAVAERLEIRWPSGLRQRFAPVAADRLYRVVEGDPALEPVVAEVRE